MLLFCFLPAGDSDVVLMTMFLRQDMHIYILGEEQKTSHMFVRNRPMSLYSMDALGTFWHGKFSFVQV